MAYTLPDLPYAYDALEPHIDEQTMRLHHDIHHKGYVTGLNTTLEKMAKARESGDFAGMDALSKDLAFHGSGHALHTIFWENMGPNGGGPATGDIAAQIDKDFGSFDAFKAHFTAASNQVKGSGWGILGWHKEFGKLMIIQAQLHNDMTVHGITPLLVLDVWEHAYYLKYQNKRPAYTDAFFNVINWDDVNARFKAAQA
ncbi:superoxide dismutase [bacterium]|nr:superoxide dismutase [bacterium]